MSWEKFVGSTLPSGWLVKKLMERKDGDTGSVFSVQFLLQKNEKLAFMKAFDVAKIFFMSAGDPKRIAEELASINFENMLLEMCLTAGTKAVLTPIESGKIQIAGVNMDQPIDYIIFEKGERDVRRYHNYREEVDHLTNLFILKRVATGLGELHTLEIAHQDLKPSNVMLFEQDVARIIDLGKASHRPRRIWHDDVLFAGDRSYAPIETLYNECNTDWHLRRVSGDLYMLGSLALFLFTSVNLTTQLVEHLEPKFRPVEWKDGYRDVMPYIRVALRRTLTAHECFSSKLGAQLARVIRELCDPDPCLRGSPHIGLLPARFDMRRYVSFLERLLVETRIHGTI